MTTLNVQNNAVYSNNVNKCKKSTKFAKAGALAGAGTAAAIGAGAIKLPVDKLHLNLKSLATENEVTIKGTELFKNNINVKKFPEVAKEFINNSFKPEVETQLKAFTTLGDKLSGVLFNGMNEAGEIVAKNKTGRAAAVAVTGLAATGLLVGAGKLIGKGLDAISNKVTQKNISKQSQSPSARNLEYLD